MPRDSMRSELVVAILLYIKRVVLVREKYFTTKSCFVDKSGNPLPSQAASVPNVAQRNIVGAVIEALVELGLDANASERSTDYFAVMHQLGESIRSDLMNQPIMPKLEAIMEINDKDGYAGVLKLVEKTAARLFFESMW